MKAQDGDLIMRRRTRQGPVVILEYLPSADEGNPWQTTCDEHGGVCSHTTREIAESFVPVPDQWCEDCMHGPGTLSGDREV